MKSSYYNLQVYKTAIHRNSLYHKNSSLDRLRKNTVLDIENIYSPLTQAETYPGIYST
jgi:hypothetical protein